jgi:hypothetical protein
MSVNITSAQNTWREETWQYFFSDDSELVVTVGHAMPENTGDGRRFTLDWQTETPDWAVNMTDAELLELVEMTEVTA